MGDNSTPILHLLCGKMGRKLFSYDFDPTWLDKFKSYENDNHKILLLYENLFQKNLYKFPNKCSVAFIDSHPPWTRHHALSTLRDCADYFIFHDSFWNENNKISRLNLYDFSYFKNVLHFTKVKNGTTICSNKEIPEELAKIFK